MKKKPSDKVSIVAPAYENTQSLPVFLRTLEGCCRAEEYELIVVDDASKNLGLRDVVAGFPRAKYIRLKKNLGPAGSRNAGAKKARGDILLFADSDSRVMSNIVYWAKMALRDQSYSAVIGAPDPCPANPGWFSDFWALVKAECLPKSREGGSFYPAIGAIRRSVFWRVGGFDEKLRSLEDFELSDRLKRAGCRVRFERRMILRFFYPPALRNLRQSFLRAGKWMILRWGGFSFDRHTTTRRQAAGVVLGALGFPVLLAAVLGGLAWQWVMGWLSVYLGVLWPFLRFCRRQKSSFYQPIAVVLHMLLALVVVSGVARAVLWRVTRAGPLEEFITTHDN